MINLKTTTFANKDQLVLELCTGKFFGIEEKVPHIQVTYGEYNEGTYGDPSAEGHHYMAALGKYFPITKLDEALDYYRITETYFRNLEKQEDKTSESNNKLYAEYHETVKKLGYSMEEIHQINTEYFKQ